MKKEVPKKEEAKKEVPKKEEKPKKFKTLFKSIKITIRKVRVWPTKPSGRCWDPCFGKKYKLPSRDKKNYMEYFNNKVFSKACCGGRLTRSKLPDPFVSLRIGKYDTFTTDKIDNTCTPNFNVSKVFHRVSQNDGMLISVYDNDGAAGLQIKKDTMGIRGFQKIPNEIWEGKKLVLHRFGQIEKLVLEAQVLKTITDKPQKTKCDGEYRVRIVEAEVKTRKSTGKTWDWKWAGSKPDLIVKMKIGPYTIQTPKKGNTFVAKFKKAEQTIAIKKNMPVNLKVLDKDPKGSEIIGQHAVTDVCTLINAKGIYTFAKFDQVVKVVVIFEKK